MASNQKNIPNIDIVFTLPGVDGEVEFSLIKLTQKTAAHVFHSTLVSVLGAMGAAVSGESDEDKMGRFVAALKTTLTFDDMWFLLSAMMTNAMVDGHEVKNLDSSTVFDDNPHFMYLVLWHGIKGNWPKVFSKAEVMFKGITSKMEAAMKGMGSNHPE
jgi:hypothetical protein